MIARGVVVAATKPTSNRVQKNLNFQVLLLTFQAPDLAEADLLFILIEALDGEDVADRISSFSLVFALFKSKLFLEVAERRGKNNEG